MNSSAGIKLNKVITILILLLVMIPAGSVLAQNVESSGPYMRRQGPDRSGFTLLLTMGVGFQKSGSSDVRTGLGGLNLGIGGFVSSDLAVMFRVSGTSVSSRRSYYGGNQYHASGVGGVATASSWVAPTPSITRTRAVSKSASNTPRPFSNTERSTM